MFIVLVHPIFANAPTGGRTERVFTNTPPVPVLDKVTTNEDVPVSGNLLANDYDPDGGPLHAIVETKTSSNGKLVIRVDGTFTYTPNPNFHGAESFSYVVCDYENSCCDGKVEILVTGTQDAPVGNPDFFSTNEDSPLDSSPGSVLENDVDTDGEMITAVIGKPTQHGTIALNQNGTFTYQPELNFYGTDTFTYYANDGVANSGETLVTITVVPVNDAPLAVDDAISTNENTPVNIPLLTNDSDVDDLLVVSMILVVAQPAHGTLVINTTAGTVVYTPNLNFNGIDSFTYKVQDAGGAVSNIAVVTITVIPVNDAPIAIADLATTPEDTPVVISVLANDTDSDNALDVGSVTVVTGPAHGTVVAQPATGTFYYTPDKDYNGTDTFTYTVKDAGGAVSLPGTVTINVTPVNDAPVAVGDAATTNENTSVDIPVLSNDFDVDNTIVIQSLKITTIPQHGSITTNTTTGVVTYTPVTNFSGPDSFTYTIQDEGGLISAPATVSVLVVNVNLPPVAVDDGPLLHESISSLTIDVLDNDYDPDNTHDELSIVSVSTPTSGSVSIVDGQIIFQPEGMLTETVTFTYTITDPEGLTDDATVTIQYRYIGITVSQGFSPNGDGNNDTWFILGIEFHPNNLVKVFNRSGLQVYQKSGYENIIAPWDGRGNTGQFAGKLVELGTYFYVLDPGDGLKNLEGYVVIIR